MENRIKSPAFVGTYSTIISDNMSDENFVKFVKFLDLHDFRKCRIEPINDKSAPVPKGFYNPDVVDTKNVVGWAKMSDMQKLSILMQKFTIQVILDEWISELPKIADFLKELQRFEFTEYDEILGEINE